VTRETLLAVSCIIDRPYLVFERPDITRIQAEGSLSDTKLNLIGVDTLIIGSLTEIGRKTVGETGFASSSKRQVAFAKVQLRSPSNESNRSPHIRQPFDLDQLFRELISQIPNEKRPTPVRVRRKTLSGTDNVVKLLSGTP
jgi:hypothetical protein